MSANHFLASLEAAFRGPVITPRVRFEGLQDTQRQQRFFLLSLWD